MKKALYSIVGILVLFFFPVLLFIAWVLIKLYGEFLLLVGGLLAAYFVPKLLRLVFNKGPKSPEES